MHKSLRDNELQPDTDLPRLIVLTTDFGDIDGYVGVLKGVILSINPQAALIDLTHSIPVSYTHLTLPTILLV